MRPKNVLTHIIIVFVLSGLLASSVFAMPTDPQKEFVAVESEFGLRLGSVEEDVSPPEFPSGTLQDEDFSSTSIYKDPRGLIEQMHLDMSSLAATDSFIPSASASSNSLPPGLDINSLPTDKITIDMAFDVVMGWVDPYQKVSVTASGISGYGYAVADEVGFFWTPIWHNTDGHQLGLSCGSLISITPEGGSTITLSPNCFTSIELDVLNDTVSGGIYGVGEGFDVTASLGSFLTDGYWQIPPVSGAPTDTVLTDSSGTFSTNVAGVDLGAESLIALDFEQAGVNIRNYVTPQNVFFVHQMNTIGGYADIGQSVTATVYEGVSTIVRWSGSTVASEPFGFYVLDSVDVEPGDSISVSLDGGSPLITTMIDLGNFTFDANEETLHGEAPEETAIRTSLWQKVGESRNYSEENVTADSSGFDITFTPDLKAYDDVLVVAKDEYGNQIQITSGPAYVLAVQNPNLEFDCVIGRMHAPDQPLTVILQKFSEVTYVRETGVYSDVGNGFSSGCFVIRAPDWSWGPIKMDPGDTATFSNGSGWSQSVDVIGFDYSWNTTTDTVSGQYMPDGEVVVTPYNWQHYLYPSYGSPGYQVAVVDSNYSASFSNFDLRDGQFLELTHYTSDGMGNAYNVWSTVSLPYFELQLHYNAISGMVTIPDDEVTVNLFENETTTEPIFSTNQDVDDNPYSFWFGDLGGNALLPGMRVELSSASGWTAEMVVPALEISGDPDLDEMTGSGPAGLLFLETWRDEFYLGKLVPSTGSSDILLDSAWDSYDLLRGDTIVLTYQATDGNRARLEGRAGYSPYDLFLSVNYDHDWIEGTYPSGYSVTLWVTDSEGGEKARTTITTGHLPWLGSGFSTTTEGVVWDPEQPDIQPEDWVFGEVTVDETTYDAEVRLGAISGTLDAETDSFTGFVSVPWLTQTESVAVQVHPWGAPEGASSCESFVLPNGADPFTCDWTTEWDVQPGQQIAALYMDPAEHWVYSVHTAYTEELILQVHYDHEWISGTYEAGHNVYLEIIDSLGYEKAHISLTTGYVDGWGSTTGFATYMEGANWIPSQPDMQPGDTIHGKVDGGTYSADLEIGDVTGTVSIASDSISGTVDVPWRLPEPIDIGCYIWESDSPGNKYINADPVTDVYPYSCSWAEEYDLQPDTDVMVAYFELAGHEVIGDFSYPSSRLRIEKWLESGELGEGGNASFRIQYRNEGQATAVNTIIADTFEGLTYISDTSGFDALQDGNTVTWQLGDLDPGEWIEFVVFAEVTATASYPVTNTAMISSDTFDAGNPEDRTRTWTGEVIANDTHLNVGKDTWTWNPAPGQNFVYSVNVCNNGPTGSTELTLTDTLPDAVALVDWWGGYEGWEEVSIVGQTLTLMYPSIPGWSCRDVYIQVALATDAVEGDELVNRAVISADNDDPYEEDNQTWLYHNVSLPYVDLYVDLGWQWGSLVPGGQYRYGIYFRNNGNMLVEGPITVSTTLPPGTIFAGWDHWEWASIIGEPVVAGDTVTWQVDNLGAGYSGAIEVFVIIDSETEPGTELVQSAAIQVQVGEDNTDNNSASLTEFVRNYGPNLRIMKWGDWHSHGDGHNAWYHIQVENIGDQTVDDVLVTDTLPDDMELDGDVGVGFWEYFEVTTYEDYFTVLLDRLEPGWNVGMDFNVVIPGEDPVPWGQVFTNTATITVDPVETNPEDNSAEFVLGTGTDMFVEKTWLNGDFLPGEEVEFLLEFGNKQPGHTPWWNMTGNAILVDTLPEGMSFVSSYWHCYQETEWCEITPTIDGQELTWTTLPLSAGERQVIVLTVLIDEEIQEENTLINTFEVSSDQPYNDIDPFPANNISSYTPDLDLEAPIITSADHTTFAFGELGSFTVTITGFPTPMIWTDDDLPSWLTLEDQADGTAILSGTPPEGGGVDYILLKAANGVTPNAEQSFTLTWEGKPDYLIFLPLILR